MAFVLRTLTKAENYSQTEKQALALIFGIFGRHFTLITDHNHCCQFSMQKQLFPLLQQPTCSTGPFFCQRILTALSIKVLNGMQMLTVYHAYQ